MTLLPWSSLNYVGRTRALRTSYFWLLFVPLAAKALERFDAMVAIPFLGSKQMLTLSLPFSWQMFYFSSVAFAIATFIYTWKCPRIVRDYDRLSDFTEEGKGSRQILAEYLEPGSGLSIDSAEKPPMVFFVF